MEEQCDPFVLPKTKTDFCKPEINFGRLDKLYFCSDGPNSAFTNWEDTTEWATRLDNEDVADVTKIRSLTIIGNKPIPENTEVALSLGRKAFTENIHTIPVRVDETNDDNYALVQWLEANKGTVVRAWYAGKKYQYGGNEGVLVNLSLNDFIPEANTEVNEFQGSIDWEGAHPDRALNIIG